MKINFLLSFLGLFCFNYSIQAQDFYDETDDSDYYKIPNLNILDSQVAGYRVFVSGENHMYAYVNNSIELQMMKYLHEKRGVRDMVIELGFVRGYMIDQYINGDTTYYEQFKRTTGMPYLKFYRDLRAWNQSLPDSERIHVHGIDIERFPDDPPVLMARILKKDSAVPERIQFLREVIRSYAEYKQSVGNIDEDVPMNYYGFNFFRYPISDSKTIDSMLIEYKRTKGDFKTYLGKDFEVFDKSMESLNDYRYYKSLSETPQQFLYRERFMFNNLQKLLDSDSNLSVFGQFGRCHIGLDQVMNDCDWWDNSPLAKRINDSKYKGKVLNIAISYPNSFYLNDMEDETDIHLYRDSMNGSRCKLFAINENDSDLRKKYQYILIAAVKGYKFTRDNEKLKSYFYSSFDLSYGASKFNLNNLNSAIDPVSKKAFDPYIMTYDINIHIKNDIQVTGINFRFYQGQNFTNSRYKYKLGGFSISESVGIAPYISRNFNFTASVLFGYNRLALRVRDDSSSFSFSPGYGVVKNQKYNNGSFILGGDLNIKIALGGLMALTIHGQTVADLSNKYWRRVVGGMNPLDNNSPKTSMFNYSLTAGLAFMFYDE